MRCICCANMATPDGHRGDAREEAEASTIFVLVILKTARTVETIEKELCFVHRRLLQDGVKDWYENIP